jgi:nitroimidazol reductase NimA-like FMN-containing flavoprotein (pyridoxamine 5'-phosphate oxidase superfamily)
VDWGSGLVPTDIALYQQHRDLNNIAFLYSHPEQISRNEPQSRIASTVRSAGPHTSAALPLRASRPRLAIAALSRLPSYYEGLIGDIGFVQNRQPFVIPTIFARADDRIIIHGSRMSRLLNHIKSRRPVCVTVTLLDGLVLARSAFHHSVNYRSVVLFGKGKAIVTDFACPDTTTWTSVALRKTCKIKLTPFSRQCLSAYMGYCDKQRLSL